MEVSPLGGDLEGSGWLNVVRYSLFVRWNGTQMTQIMQIFTV